MDIGSDNSKLMLTYATHKSERHDLSISKVSPFTIIVVWEKCSFSVRHVSNLNFKFFLNVECRYIQRGRFYAMARSPNTVDCIPSDFLSFAMTAYRVI